LPRALAQLGGTILTVTPCVFCEIIRGNAPASVVYADDRAMAFMDIQPVNPGHLLVVPRAHATYLVDLDEGLGSHLFRVGMRLAQAVRHVNVRCEGVALFLADGEAAGQEILHVHLHVIPRFAGDGFGFRFSPGYFQRPPRTILDEVAAEIRQFLTRDE
jgi:histidine triad (HIT) family protein